MDLAVVADIKYGALLDVDEQIRRLEAEKPRDSMMREEVTPEEIAKVCRLHLRDSACHEHTG